MSLFTFPFATFSLASLKALLKHLLLSICCSFAYAVPAFASHQFLEWPDFGPSAFGLNEPIIIGTGAIDFIADCQGNGIDDTLWPAADIYIVPSGSRALNDVSGSRNIVIGATTGGVFIDELIGVAGHSVAAGSYAVIYDECQDGRFDPEVDFVFDPAFVVRNLPTTTSHLPDFNEIKSNAASLYKYWTETLPADRYLAIVGSPVSDPKMFKRELFKLKTRIPQVNLLKNLIQHYDAIVKDPPDPNFQHIASLGGREVVDLRSNDPLLVATADISTAISNERALLAAFLSSLERYQGAALANNGDWALIHVRALKTYTNLLATQLTHTNTALAAMSNALSADTRPLDEIASELEAFRIRVVTEGFSTEELQEFKNLGFSDEKIAEIRQQLGTLDFSAFSKAEFLALLQNLQTTNTALIGAFTTFSADMSAIIASLEADPLVFDRSPLVNPGGPYTGVAGLPVAFDGRASTSPAQISRYEWDLDGDGKFNDATGPTPSFTYTKAFAGLVGLRVTTVEGLSNVGYSFVDIANVNSPPTVGTFSPDPRFADLIVGGRGTFNVTATDPDGDNITTIWFVDEKAVAVGSSFTYRPTNVDRGIREVTAIVADDNPLGGSIVLSWNVAVSASCGDGVRNQASEVCDGLDVGGATCQSVGFVGGTLACASDCQALDASGCHFVTPGQPDVDGDGYSADIDCNDANASVNPGKTEILRNGVDDDCNSSTLDTGLAPTANFTTTPVIGSPGEPIQFQDRSTDQDDAIVSWAWDFNNDTVVDSTEQSPQYTFSTAGISQVSLRVTDAAGHEASIRKTVPIGSLQSGNQAGFDHKGKEFLMVFLRNGVSDQISEDHHTELHLISDVDTMVTVEYPVNAPTFTTTVAVHPGTVTIVSLPVEVSQSWAVAPGKNIDGPYNRAVHASAPDEFICYLVNRARATSDATLVLPVDVWNTEYRTLSSQGSAVGKARAGIVAAYDNTHVTFRSPFLGGLVEQTVLNRGEAVLYSSIMALADIVSVLSITADKPIGVLSGNDCTLIGSGQACDHIVEMAPPVQTWGKRILVAGLPHRPSGSIYRVVTAEDNTTVTLDGAVLGTIGPQTYLNTGFLPGNHIFEGDKPIYVVQYMTGGDRTVGNIGDPAMVNMTPPEQYLSAYTFSTVGGTQFSEHFLILIAQNTDVENGTIFLDGQTLPAASFTPIGSSGFSTATVLPLTEGSHTTTSLGVHGITVGGVNLFDSYLYAGGAGFKSTMEVIH